MTAVKLPRLLRALGDLGEKGASDGPGTWVGSDAGDVLEGETAEFGTT